MDNSWTVPASFHELYVENCSSDFRWISSRAFHIYYNRKKVYHAINGDLHCFTLENSKNDKGYIT